MIRFKNEETAQEIDSISPMLKDVLYDMGKYASNSGFEFVVTDLLSSDFDDALLNRVSPSHKQGRAADVRVHRWTEEFIKQFTKHFTDKHGKLGAISTRDGKQRLIVDHVGTARHLHIQLSRKYAVK